MLQLASSTRRKASPWTSTQAAYALDSTTIDCASVVSLAIFVPPSPLSRCILCSTCADRSRVYPRHYCGYARRQHPRPDRFPARSLLCGGSRLPRLLPAAPHPSGRAFLCHSRQKQPRRLPHLLRPADKQTASSPISPRSHGYLSRKDYPSHLRRISFRDRTPARTCLPYQPVHPAAATICALYKSRWQVELFFKWIKQHLRIKAFYGTSENAVKTQLWIAISVYLLLLSSKAPRSARLTLHFPASSLSYYVRENAISQALQQKDTQITAKNLSVNSNSLPPRDQAQASERSAT